MSTATRFFEMKRQGKPIAMLTAYDAPTARAQAEGGVDVILVGDSVGTNMLGYTSEREVKLSDITHHVAAVRRGAPDTYIIGDLPYATYDSVAQGLDSSRAIIAAGANMVKFEGPHVDLVEALVKEGIPVCCHLGLEPQHHEEKRLKGKTATDAAKLVADAIAVDKAGMSMIVLEVIPEEVAQVITQKLKAPTIGIGAGRFTDGQVLVMPDVLGYTQSNFRHNKRFAEVGIAMREASAAYTREVHERSFPAEPNAFHMPKDELALFKA